ncbi:TMhelix containing protein [Vibrio phage 1.047.O._10N.286.55.F2]|nr:TMhelix containing protein [Vibrio phage 1.047.O._10N.286.55.F2]
MVELMQRKTKLSWSLIVIDKYIKYIYWWAAVAIVFFRNEEVISSDSGYISAVIVMLAGCFVFGGKDD